MPKLTDIRKDPEPADGSMPRRESKKHIAKHRGSDRDATVGDSVSGAISSIQMLSGGNGERGARDVDRVFTDPSLNDVWSQPATNTDAQRRVASREDPYWKYQDANNPTPGSAVAASYSEDQRVGIQQRFGQAYNQTQQHLVDYDNLTNPAPSYERGGIPYPYQQQPSSGRSSGNHSSSHSSSHHSSHHSSSHHSSGHHSSGHHSSGGRKKSSGHGHK